MQGGGDLRVEVDDVIGGALQGGDLLFSSVVEVR